MLLLISFEESISIVILALLLFGPKKIPQVARSLGEGIRKLRDAKERIKQEIWEASEKINEQEISSEMKKEIKELEGIVEDSLSNSVKRNDS